MGRYRYLCLFVSVWLLPLTGMCEDAMTMRDAQAEAVSVEQTLLDLNTVLLDSYFHAGDFDRCVAICERQIALNPVGIDPYTIAAWLLWSSHRNDEAQRFYERMLAANPDDAQGYFEYGVFYVRLHDDEKALPLLSKAVDLGLPSPQRHFYGHTLKRLGRTEEALAFWRRILADDPDDEVAQREISALTKNTPTPPQ